MAESFSKDRRDDEVTSDDDSTSSESDISEDSSFTDEISEDSNVTRKISDKDHYEVSAEEKKKYESWIRSDVERFQNELKKLEAERDECTCPYAKNLANITISLLIKSHESMQAQLAPWMKRGNQKLGESSKEDIQTLTDMKTEKNTAEEKDNLLMKQCDKLGEETVTGEKPKKDSAGTSALVGSFHKQGQEKKCMLDPKPDSSLKAKKEEQMSHEQIIKSMSRSMHKAMIRSGSEISIDWLENELRDFFRFNGLMKVKVEDGHADVKGGKKTYADCEVKNNPGKEEWDRN